MKSVMGVMFVYTNIVFDLFGFISESRQIQLKKKLWHNMQLVSVKKTFLMAATLFF